jgi:hypothetical protein
MKDSAKIRTTRKYVSEQGKKVQFDVDIRKIYLGKETNFPCYKIDSTVSMVSNTSA